MKMYMFPTRVETPSEELLAAKYSQMQNSSPELSSPPTKKVFVNERLKISFAFTENDYFTGARNPTDFTSVGF